MSDIISKVKNLFSFNQTKEETEDKSNCSPESYSEDDFEELEETNKLLNDLSKDLKTKAIENIDFNSYFDKIDQEYVQSRFVKYIKDFIDNYHDESDDPFNYIENDIIFRMAIILGILETKIKRPSKSSKNIVIPLEDHVSFLSTPTTTRDLDLEYIHNYCIPYYEVFEENGKYNRR